MQAQPSPRRPPVPPAPSTGGSGGVSPQRHALEQQLDIAVRQVESTKRLYERLHEHNDDMEGEFLRLRGILEGFRNRMQFAIRQDVRRLRGDLDSIRDTVVFHAGSFQRELHALERVLSSAIGNGSVLACDHDILYTGSGRVAAPQPRNRPASGGEGAAVVAPRPVATLNSPPPRPGVDPKHRAAQLREAANALREGPPPGRSTASKNPLDATPLRVAAKGSRKRLTKPTGAAAGRSAGDVSSAQDESSIEFYSDAEGAATDTSPRTTTLGRRTSRASLASAKKDAGERDDARRTPPNLVMQAVEVAQQRAVAERQGKQIGELNDALQKTHLDKLQLQEQLKHQNEQFQAYLHQMKAVHKEEAVTLRGQIELLTQAVACQQREVPLRYDAAAVDQGHASHRRGVGPHHVHGNGKRHGAASNGERSSSESSMPLDHHATPSSSLGLQSNLFGTDASGTSAARARRHRKTQHQSTERQRAEAHAKEVLEERHRQHGFAPREERASDVIRDGLWAQRVLEQRSANTIRPLFPKPGIASRSPSASSASHAGGSKKGVAGYAQRKR